LKRNGASGVISSVKLENIHIASPCRADWNEMTGDDRVRTCAACAKQVFNLSEMTRAEAEAVLAERGSNLCGRYYQRRDGTILLADCTIGGSGARTRSFVLAAALAAGAAYAKLHRGSPPSEATKLDGPLDEPPSTEVHEAVIDHDSPPPPRKLTLPQIHVTPPPHEEVFVTGGAIAITVHDIESPETSSK
jgi:hypothetical protein